MIDPYLQALVRSAEAGEPCPPIWATLTSGDFVSGTPVPSATFLDQSRRALEARYEQRAWRKQVSDPVARAASDMALLTAPAADGASTITLSQARVLRGGRGDGVELPSVRLALDAIATWWMAGGSEIKSGGSFFFGAVIPIEM